MSMLVDDRPPPVEHRLLGMDRRKFLPVLEVLALVIFWGGVIPAINEAIAGDEIEAGTVFDLTLGVSFAPAAGWLVDGVPAPSSPKLSVYDDGVKFTISSGAFVGTPDELLDTIRDLRDDFEVEGDQESLSTASGIPGSAVEIVGTNFNGGLFAFVAVDPDADPAATSAILKASSV